MYQCDKTIAILLATYNGEKYLTRQIDSLLKQTYQNFNVYIHDDGSTDNTKKIVNSYCRQYPEKIFCLEGKSTGGAKNNFFYLMRNVSAQYYMFCDQDDYWKEKKIEISLNAIKNIEKEESIVPTLVFSDLEVVDASLKTIHPSMNRMQKLTPNNTSINKLLCQNPTTGCTIIMNSALNNIALKYKNENNIIMHDWWIALVAARYGRIAYIDQALIKYCQHAENTIGAYNPGNIKYINKKLTNFSLLKKAIDNSRNQAKEFCYVFGIENNEIAYAYSVLKNHSKFYKLIFYIKHHIWKNGLVRNIGFILLG